MYTRDELSRLNLLALREYGRAIGVRRCTTFRKYELIEQILKVQSGEQEACFNRLGRPHLPTCLDKEIERQIELSKVRKKEYYDVITQTKKALLKQLDSMYEQMKKTIIEEMEKLKKLKK